MPPEIEQEIQSSEPLSLRDTISASFDAVESAAPDTAAPEVATEAPVSGRARDEHGRFAPVAATPAVAAQPEVAPEAAPVAETPQEKRELTTWKREMRPLQEKLARGEALNAEEATRLAQYNIEREQNYATGISGYKAQAEQAREYVDAMQEFLPALQQAGLRPGEWIQNLGRAHSQLVYGQPAQKIQMFAQLAQDYGVPLDAVMQFTQGGGVNPQAMQGMQQQSQVMQELQSVKQWMNQQQESEIAKEVARFTDASKYPHFERVRGVMAQLLESGLANDPDSAYEKAVRLDGEAWQAEQQRQAATQQAQQSATRAAAAAQARKAGVSLKSSTPAGMVTSAAKPGNLRADIEAATEQVLGGGRV